MAAPTAQQTLNRSRAKIGTVEKPRGTNLTEFGAWYGWNGVAWCAIFQCWVFAMANAIALIGGKTASTVLMAAWFQRVGRWGHTPKVGALAFFDFPDAIDRIQHVEIVESIRPDGRIVTIGGNTSADDQGSQDNGDGVWRKVRSTVHVVGYGYPAYSAAGKATPVKDAKPAAKPAVPLLLVDGVWGATTTRALQRVLSIPVDGVLGPQTRRAVQKWLGFIPSARDGVWGRVTRRALQRKLGVVPDGKIGKVTIKALQKWLNRHRYDV